VVLMFGQNGDASGVLMRYALIMQELVLFEVRDDGLQMLDNGAPLSSGASAKLLLRPSYDSIMILPRRIL